MKIPRSSWSRFLRHPVGQFTIVSMLILALFALVDRGVAIVLQAVFGGHWMVF
ncbi:hypothetical protein [Streptomyces katrae]|uniref:hypothetical protein n=1 Tax=Streptomyces katrae TaxID=68223 RepID=UPI0012FF2379|nr:hypothetical protein [Streptomyces katrae]